MSCWLERTGAIWCPQCRGPCGYGNVEWNSDAPVLVGNTHCEHCVIWDPGAVSAYGDGHTYQPPVSSILLTFNYSYDILTGGMVTDGHGFRQEYSVDPYFGNHN